MTLMTPLPTEPDRVAAKLNPAYPPLNRLRPPPAQLEQRMAPGRYRLDLQEAPLMRLEIAADPHSAQWYAVLRTHHLVCDNVSSHLLICEVMECLEGRAHCLPQPVAYRNHVARV